MRARHDWSADKRDDRAGHGHSLGPDHARVGCVAKVLLQRSHLLQERCFLLRGEDRGSPDQPCHAFQSMQARDEQLAIDQLLNGVRIGELQLSTGVEDVVKHEHLLV